MTATIALVVTLLWGGARYADFVDTNVGVVDKGASNCVVGPMVPYGSINPSPQSEKGTSDGYKPTRPIRGFGQMHVSGTGWPTYGNFLITPETALETRPLCHDSEHSSEVTLPYYFSTFLERYGIRAEVTPSHYSAIYRFTYPESGVSSIVFDAAHAIPGDIFPAAPKTIHSCEASVDGGLVRMMVSMTGGWPEQPYTLYFVGKIDKNSGISSGCWRDSTVYGNESSIKLESGSSDHIGVYLSFPTKESEQVLLKTAVSFRGYDEAMGLLDDEIPLWDFDAVRNKARRSVGRRLSSIRIATDKEDERTIFYSSLYRFYTFARERTLDRPSGYEEAYWDDNYAYWDTFRTVYPLLLLLDEDSYRDNLNAIAERFEKRGGVWDTFVAGTDRKADQGGNDIDQVIVDAYVKGLDGVDWERLYKVVRHNADSMRLGFDPSCTDGRNLRYKELGWIPACTMSSSQTLEFAYNDWCAARMARGLGHTEDAERWLRRSSGWEALWNPDLESRGYMGFIDARDTSGAFLGIDPERFGGSWVSPFYEGRSWTYSYYVPHDMQRVIELMGGKEKFVERLQYGYEHSLTEYDNEPGFLTLRAFTDAGRPDLSSVWAHRLMDKKFTLKGYPDNEDTGSMGSWYVFCAIGLFPDAGQDFYYLNVPKYRKVTVRLSNGRRLRIVSDISAENTAYSSATFRGREVQGAVISHRELMRGGRLRITGTKQTFDK